MYPDLQQLNRIATLAALVGIGAGALAAAERQIGPAEFEAMSRGATLLFDRNGLPYGAETYLANRQVLWRHEDGPCQAGHWFGLGDQICFIYENNPSAQCWVFVERNGDFFARIAGLPSGDASEIRLAGESPEPLDCPGPNLGV